ncbi:MULTISPECIES: Gfo/Idh/MocA family oxidoreductase [unclassified Streptomyces]|uniref:Gfo/Idh/MocA family protein n=1 Tax=unclassified Streptomyces TaxID=2593676 RepID=UPI0025B4300F|nr:MULTISPECIES: Gfo/Idh/MocA family oxidoreductase [unclassified Streptomyces]MDN3251037.1 Gfo/Idh/MocA family oxidoreductase [Streptomyces sp. ZSW22]MDN3257724.1 Gfo/Idh/MocA family oxidoreductase [Streptomyces sp. MA25(2023)]
MIAAIGNSEYLSRRTAPLLRELNGTDAPLLVGTDHPSGARAAARAEGVEIIDRDAVLSAPDVDAVYVSSATGRHFDDCSAALAAGKHVLVEKPVCLTAAEARALDSMARARDLTVFECLSYPYHPAWTAFLAEVRAAAWSGPVSVSAVFRIPGREPTDFRRHPRHGRAAADLGTYCLDALVRLGAAAEDLRIGVVLLEDLEADGGVAVASRPVDGHTFTYTGTWTIGDTYANAVVVADHRRRLELLRVFSPPVDAPRQVVERRPGAPEPAVVATSEPVNATRACLTAGARHLRDTGTAGLVGCPALVRRIAALEGATAALPA